MIKKSIKRIVNSASKLFTEYGYSKVTMDEIAAKAGVTKKTIYNNFSSKEDLIHYVVQEKTNIIVGGLEEIAYSTEITFLEKLEKIISFLFLEFNVKNKNLIEEYHNLAAPTPQEKMIPQIREAIIKLSGELLDEGIALGVIRENIPKQVVSYLFITLVDGLQRLYKDTMPPFTPGQFLVDSIWITGTGIFTPRGREIFRKRTAQEHEKEEI